MNIETYFDVKTLHDELNRTKFCAKMVSKNLSQKRKNNRNNRLLTKRHSIGWKIHIYRRMKEVRMGKSKLKEMLIFFLFIQGCYLNLICT